MAAADQWVALRALHEERGAGFDLLAAASGRTVRAIEARAAAEEWSGAGGASDGDVVGGRKRAGSVRTAGRRLSRAERIDQQIDRLIARVELICDECDAKGTLDKAAIEEVSALTRTLEKMAEITRSRESAKENQMKRDINIGKVLRRIDQQIVTLAKDYAKRLVAKKPVG